ncbi:MAG: MoaD/ThiS family protein [Fibrobacteria bacterium]
MIETSVGLDVTVEYFALFRSCARKSLEKIHLDESAPAALYDALRARYRFPLAKELVHLVVNDEYSPWDKALQPGDRVVFIPPVSGG